MYLNLYPKRRVMFVNGINLPSYKSLPQFLNKKPQGAMLSLLDGVLVHRMLSLPLLPPALKKNVIIGLRSQFTNCTMVWQPASNDKPGFSCYFAGYSQKSLTKRKEKMITLSLAGGSGVFNMVEFLSTLANEASHSSNVVASQNLWSPWSFYEEHRHIQHHENIVTIWAIGFGEVFLLKVWLNRISIINKLIFIAYPLQTV